MGAAEEFDLDEDLTPSVVFDFDDDFQERIITLATRDTSFRRRTDGLVKPEHFNKVEHGVLFDISSRYYDKYQTLPGSPAVWAELIRDECKSGGTIREDMKVEIITALKGILKGDVSDRDYVAEKVGEFAKNQAVAAAILESIDLHAKGKLDLAEKILKKAFDTGAQEDFQIVDYWNGVDGRTEYRKKKASGEIAPRGIPTGLAKFDNLLYHKGWGKRELSVLMGGAKRGKSMGLGEFALRASLKGFNALYITLEVSPDIIADRMDSNFTITRMDDLEAHMHDIRDKVKLKSTSGKCGALKIVEFPSGSLTPKAVRRVLERFKAEGIIFDLLVVDYADIMKPDERTNDPIENSKNVWLGLRAIAQIEDLAVLTATQTNRSGYTESTAKAEHASEDFNKVRIADLLISINRDDDEKERGVARLYFAASRNQEGDFAIEIQQDLATMRFITGIGAIVTSEKSPSKAPKAAPAAAPKAA